ncbi:hypothetical protein F4778DRAFT_742755 [Xylariomycetidae sp. FL2044]|nr:hypothetical protein F4778DRAFT_742755 [Xylariomycetidae sp. FL2044]
MATSIRPDILSNMKYSPPVSTSLKWVPEKERLIIEIWRKVDENNWLLGDELLVSRRNAPRAAFGVNDYLCAWGHGDDDPDSFYALFKNTIVLAALRNHHPEEVPPLSFSYPKALYNAEYNDRYYFITTAVPGSTVRDAWPAMDETARQRCAQNVARICRELASWRSDRMGFVDGTPNENLATWLNSFGKADYFADNALEKLFSYFVFFHGDMGPTNVLVDRNNNDSIGLASNQHLMREG